MAGPAVPAVSQARRAAGLTEKELAERLGLSLFRLEQMERGDVDPAPYAEALARHTGRPASSFVLARRPAKRDGRPDRPPAPRAPRQARPLDGGGLLVLGSIAALVLLRFVTETVHFLPRAVNFVDVPIVLALGTAAVLSRKSSIPADRFSRALLPASLAFLLLTAAGTLTNLSQVEIAPALVFVYAVLSPLAIYRAVQVLWPVGNARIASKVLVALGVIQLIVATLVDLPRFLSSNNPDVVSGTFGTNPYQFVFFMLMFITLLAGVYAFQRGRLVARMAPLMIGASFLFIVLAQYRALLLTTGLSILLVAVVLSRAPGKARGFVVAAVGILAFSAALAFGAERFPILKLSETFDQRPSAVFAHRFDVLTSVKRLYFEEPRFVLTGSGPGTFSSRGWQTFALSDSRSESNVQGGYAQKLIGGRVYHTDVSDRHVRPLLTTTNPGTSFAGSRAANSPYSDYSSVAAEVGIFGLFILVAIYLGALREGWRRVRRAVRSARPDDPVPALLLVATIGLFALIQMALLDNWLEVTRLTFVVWITLAIAGKEFDARSGAVRP
jgi:hypothetical protein